MRTNSYLQIDLQAVRENIATIRQEIGPKTGLIPVLKGNAYGLGAKRLAQLFADMDGIDAIAVSHAEEGIELREAGIRQQILVMSLPLPFQAEEAAARDLTLTLGSFEQLPVFREASRKLGRRIPVSLKLDTGLHRIGFLPEETGTLITALKDAADILEIRDCFSHYSDHSPAQIALQSGRFRAMIGALREAGINPGLCHMASSASIEAGGDVLFDAVRVGRRFYMDNPDQPTGKIREAVSFRAYVTDVREREAGETVGYNGCVTLEAKTRVGVLSIGYGDGLDPGLAAAKAPVLIRGQRARLLACCMDQSLVDLGSISVVPGDEVTLFGHDGEGAFLSAQEVAAWIGCEGCDLTARLTERVARIYTGE